MREKSASAGNLTPAAQVIALDYTGRAIIYYNRNGSGDNSSIRVAMLRAGAFGESKAQFLTK
jgi:hypothetical protein